MSLMPVYLGLNGMNMTLTGFYYTHLSQSNISDRLISLCVSDTLAIDNGLWLASHLSTFINLRHLSLIDIKRSSFELILNAFSSNISLVMFSVHFPTYYRAADTFEYVPEGAYYERIFHLFPLLHVCHLRFWRYMYKTLDRQVVPPLGKAFMPIQTSHLNLQSIVLRHCSLAFLSHLLEHLPQLQELRFELSTPWLPDEHPLMHDHNNRIAPIGRRLAPNLCRLKISWNECYIPLESINKLFERDVLFSLTNFTLEGFVTGSHAVHNLLSILSDRCLYMLDVKWYVATTVSLSETSSILLDTFQQLKGRVPIELELFLDDNNYSIRALTVPRIDKCLSIYTYLHKNTVLGQSRWPYNRRTVNNRLIRFNKIKMGDYYAQIGDESLYYSPSIVPWHQITSLGIDEPFNLTRLYLLFSQTTNLRNLDMYCALDFEFKDYSKQETLINFLNDVPLCNMLMSNGLRQVNFSIESKQRNLIDIACLIVERLPYLQVIHLDCVDSKVTEMLHILINGLPKLNFLTLYGGYLCGNLYDKRLRDLQSLNTRSFRTEVHSAIIADILFVWL